MEKVTKYVTNLDDLVLGCVGDDEGKFVELEPLTEEGVSDEYIARFATATIESFKVLVVLVREELVELAKRIDKLEGLEQRLQRLESRVKG